MLGPHPPFLSLYLVFFLPTMFADSVTGVTNGIDNGLNAAERVDGQAQVGIDLINSFQALESQAQQQAYNLLQTMNTQYCPKPIGSVCLNIINEVACDYSKLPNRDAFKQVVALLKQMAQGASTGNAQSTANQPFAKLFNFKNDLQDVQKNAKNVYAKAEDLKKNYNWAFICARVFAILLAVASIGLMISVVLSWTKKMSRPFLCFRNYFILPLFIIMLILSWLFSMIFVIGTLGTADLCHTNPDSRMIALINRMSSDELVLQFTKYVIEGTRYS